MALERSAPEDWHHARQAARLLSRIPPIPDGGSALPLDSIRASVVRAIEHAIRRRARFRLLRRLITKTAATGALMALLGLTVRYLLR
jgi:hypothetical protein